MNRFAADFDFDNFQSIIDLMSRAGWLKRAREDSEDVSIEWSELGQAKVGEMKSLVTPFVRWLRDRTGPKPDLADQQIIANSLAPYLRELGWQDESESESLKLIAFVALLAP